MKCKNFCKSQNLNYKCWKIHLSKTKKYFHRFNWSPSCSLIPQINLKSYTKKLKKRCCSVKKAFKKQLKVPESEMNPTYTCLCYVLDWEIFQGENPSQKKKLDKSKRLKNWIFPFIYWSALYAVDLRRFYSQH